MCVVVISRNKQTTGLGRLEKFTGKLIDELIVYYGRTVIRNCDSVALMKDAIWATLQHKSSNIEPHHENFPPESNSLCSW